MKIIKQDKYRQISLSYEEMRKFYNIKFKGEFTISTTTCSSNPFHIYHFRDGITIWEIEYTRKEIEEKLNLLPFEKVIDFDYIVFYGYAFKIKTTKKNLLALKLMDEIRLEFCKNFITRFFSLKFNIERLCFNDYKLLIDKNEDSKDGKLQCRSNSHNWKKFELDFNDVNYEENMSGSMRHCLKCKCIQEYYCFNSSINADVHSGFKNAESKKVYYAKIKLNLK